ncbi:MAG: hypothetical protein ACLGHT_09995 [Acidimicrobiia bacterium]
MSDPEAPEPEVEVEDGAPSRDVEAPEGDALEQAEPVVGGAAGSGAGPSGFEANEADVQEQLREETVEDDDYGR